MNIYLIFDKPRLGQWPLKIHLIDKHKWVQMSFLMASRRERSLLYHSWSDHHNDWHSTSAGYINALDECEKLMLTLNSSDNVCSSHLNEGPKPQAALL